QFNLGQPFRAEFGFVAKSNLIEDHERSIGDGARRGMADRKPQRHLDIFANGHSPEWPRDLIGPRQPALGPKPGWRFGNVVGVERYRSFIRRQDSRQAIHERALAGSIRADETDALALQQS